jgi:N-acetyl-anhydromuramyl-L-alanine amidase AmpD
MYANDDVAEQFNAVNEGHRKRWNGKTKSKMGFYGGYHYIVERNGAIQQFRGEDETGAHNNVSLMNYRAIGVCFAGNMSRQNLSDAQIVSGVRLIKGIQARHNILDKNIKPHRFYKATQCPGNNFADPVWDYLQEKHESMSPKQEGWKKKEEKWASKYIKDMPGFLASYDPHKMIALIHRAIEDKQ